MATRKKVPARKSRMTNEKVVSILTQRIEDVVKMVMQEIVDVRRELKQDIATLDMKLNGRIDGLQSDVQTLRLEVHQNHVSFMKYQRDLDTRITRVEAKVG